MRLQLILFGFLIFLINPILIAQKINKNDLLGEWHLVKLTMDTSVIFDMDYIDDYKERNLAKLRELKPDYTQEDSLKEIEHIDKGVEEIKKMYFQFNKDNTYSTRRIKSGRTTADYIENGKYKVFNKGLIQLIDSKGNKSTCEVNLVERLLIMIFKSTDRKIVMGFKK